MGVPDLARGLPVPVLVPRWRDLCLNPDLPVSRSSARLGWHGLGQVGLTFS